VDQSNPKNYVESEQEYFARIEAYFSTSSGTYTEKMQAFPRFVHRQALSYFLARNEIYKEVVAVHGSVVDFGIHRGASFFSWQQLAALYEPYNHSRKIIGFDSFEGFSALDPDIDGAEGRELALKRTGGMTFRGGEDELQRGVELCDLNRPLGHVRNAHVVAGELPGAFATYLEQHPETIVALANFGLGLYRPTVELLSLLRPRLHNGSLLVFEELNQATWPGETKALIEVFGLQEVNVRRFPFCPHLSYMRVGGDGA